MSDYKNITNEDFERILFKLINQSNASHLLTIPGVYDAVAEDYNNEVLAHWKQEQGD